MSTEYTLVHHGVLMYVSWYISARYILCIQEIAAVSIRTRNATRSHSKHSPALRCYYGPKPSSSLNPTKVQDEVGPVVPSDEMH